MNFEPIFKTTDEINVTAETFLTTYCSSYSIPIPIEEITDLQLQINIIPIPGLKDTFEKIGLDIDAFISSDFKSITVDEYISNRMSNRYRFTLAHELGHMLLHRYLYEQFKFNNIPEWINTINQIPMEHLRTSPWCLKVPLTSKMSRVIRHNSIFGLPIY